MNLIQLNWNIFLYFYDSFLGEATRNIHQKTIAVPRYSHGTVFHWTCLIQMLFKISMSNIFIFFCSSFELVMSSDPSFIFPSFDEVKK